MSGCWISIIPATNNIITYEIDSHFKSEQFINAIRERLYFIRITAAMMTMMMLMMMMMMMMMMPITALTTSRMSKESDYMYMLAVADSNIYKQLDSFAIMLV